MSCITKILFFVITLLCIQSSFAHTYLSTVFLNNERLREGDCVRPHPQFEKDYPLPSVTANEMTCGWLPAASNPANRKCPMEAGSKIGIQWYHGSNSPSDDIIEATHKGPVIFYMAKSETGKGAVWFKIYEDGLVNGRWGVDRLLDNKGRVDVTIPIDIAPGNYLLRGEILALHNAYDVGGIQPYVGCVELSISGSGSANPSGVSFPGAYTPTGPGMLLNIYQAYNSYVIPGPALYRPGSLTPSSTPSPTFIPTSTPSISPSTSSPTSTPSISPSTSAPTNKPTYSPATNLPTNSPATYPPTNSPSTPAPSNGNGNNENIKVGLNGGSNAWWVAAIVSGGAKTTVKVEIMDSLVLKNWVSMVDQSFAYVYSSSSAQLIAPISLRVTSSSGKQVVLTNVFSSFSTGNSLIDTGKSYSSSSTPTFVPTSNPTLSPSTSSPTNSPSSGNGGCDASSVVLVQTNGGSWDSNGKQVTQFNVAVSHTCSGKRLTGLTFSVSNWNPFNFWNLEKSSSSSSSSLLSLPSYASLSATSSPFVFGYQNSGSQATFTITSVTFQ